MQMRVFNSLAQNYTFWYFRVFLGICCWQIHRPVDYLFTVNKYKNFREYRPLRSQGRGRVHRDRGGSITFTFL